MRELLSKLWFKVILGMISGIALGLALSPSAFALIPSEAAFSPSLLSPVCKVSKISSKSFLCAGEINLSKADKASLTFDTSKSLPIFIQVENRLS